MRASGWVSRGRPKGALCRLTIEIGNSAVKGTSCGRVREEPEHGVQDDLVFRLDEHHHAAPRARRRRGHRTYRRRRHEVVPAW